MQCGRRTGRHDGGRRGLSKYSPSLSGPKVLGPGAGWDPAHR
jgi:hypothetical protein